jgi:hypothetical protein
VYETVAHYYSEKFEIALPSEQTTEELP